MDNSQAKDLFHLQTDLIDAKVDMAVSKAIDRVLDRIDHLDKGINQKIDHLEKDMNKRFTHLDERFTILEYRVRGTEDSLRSLKDILDPIRNKFIDYCFKGAWIVGSTVVVYTLSRLLSLIK